MLVEAVVSHRSGGSWRWYGDVGGGALFDRVLAVNVADRSDLVPQNSENRFVKIKKTFRKMS